MATTSPPRNNGSTMHTLPPLVETFPADKYPLREVGTGFTAQSVRGVEADACAATAAEMLVESRDLAMSAVSSEGSVSLPNEAEAFIVPDLPLPEGAVQDGMLILRNERLFPGMVGISLPLKGTLWVREDGTFNLSGFFRRQIPKFEAGALVAATSNMAEFLDVYHAMYRPAMETAAFRKQFKVIRTAIGAGLQYYTDENSTARRELMDVRRRVQELMARSSTGGPGREYSDSSSTAASTSLDTMATVEVMEGRRRSSDEKADEKDGERRQSGASQSSSGAGSDDTDGGRKSRNASDQRSSKIAQQVVTGAPKQKAPFRLWKSKTGEESYDKATPS